MSPITPPVASPPSTPTVRSRQASGESSSSSSNSSGLRGVANTPPSRSRRSSGGTPAPIPATADTMRQTGTLRTLHDCLQGVQRAVAADAPRNAAAVTATGLLSRSVHGRLVLDLQLPAATEALRQATVEANLQWLVVVEGLVRENRLSALDVAHYLLYPDAHRVPAPSTSCYLREPQLGRAFVSLLATLEQHGAVEVGAMHRQTLSRLRSVPAASDAPGERDPGEAAQSVRERLAAACAATGVRAQAQLEAGLIRRAVEERLPALVTQSECDVLERAVRMGYAQEGARALAGNPLFPGASHHARSLSDQVHYALDVFRRDMENLRGRAGLQLVDTLCSEYVQTVERNPGMTAIERGATLRRLTEAALQGIDQMVWMFHPRDATPPQSLSPITSPPRAASPVLPEDAVGAVGSPVLDLSVAEVAPANDAGSNCAYLAEVEGIRWRVKSTGSGALSAMEMTLARVFQLTGLEAPDTALAAGLAVDAGHLQADPGASRPLLFASQHDAGYRDLGHFLVLPQAAALVAARDPAQGEIYAGLQRQHAEVVAQQQALLDAAGAAQPWFLHEDTAIARYAGLDTQRFSLLEAMTRRLPDTLRDDAARHYIASRWLDNWDHLNYRMENFGYTLRDGQWTGMTVDFGSCGPIGFRDLQTGQMQTKARSGDIARQQRPAALFPLPVPTGSAGTAGDRPGVLADAHDWPYGVQSESVAAHARSATAADVVAEMGYRLYLVPDAGLAALVERDWPSVDASSGWPDAQALISALELRRQAILEEIGVAPILRWMRADPQAAARVRGQLAANLQRALGHHDGLAGFRQGIEQAHGALDTLDTPDASPPEPAGACVHQPSPADSRDAAAHLSRRVASALARDRRGQRSEQVLYLAEALDEACALAPDARAVLLQPRVAGGIASVLQRQQDLAEPDTTLQLARIAAASYDRAVSDVLQHAGGAAQVANALAGGAGDWRTSALSETLVGRGRAALAPWSQLILAEVPARLHRADPTIDLLRRDVQDDGDNRTTLKKALKQAPVDRGYTLRPAQPAAPGGPTFAQSEGDAAASAVHEEADRAGALAIIRERAPAQIAADRRRARELDDIEAAARRVTVLDQSPQYLRQQQDAEAQKARDAAVAAACLARHAAAEQARYVARQHENAQRRQAADSRAVAKARRHGEQKRAEGAAIAAVDAALARRALSRASAAQQQQRHQREAKMRQQLDNAATARASGSTPAVGLPRLGTTDGPARSAATHVTSTEAGATKASGAEASTLVVHVTAQGHSVTAANARACPDATHAASRASARTHDAGGPPLLTPRRSGNPGLARIRTLQDLRQGALPEPLPPTAPTPATSASAVSSRPRALGTAAQGLLGASGIREFSADARRRWRNDYYDRPVSDRPAPPDAGAADAQAGVRRLGGARDAESLQRARSGQQRALWNAAQPPPSSP